MMGIAGTLTQFNKCLVTKLVFLCNPLLKSNENSMFLYIKEEKLSLACSFTYFKVDYFCSYSRKKTFRKITEMSTTLLEKENVYFVI